MSLGQLVTSKIWRFKDSGIDAHVDHIVVDYTWFLDQQQGRAGGTLLVPYVNIPVSELLHNIELQARGYSIERLRLDVYGRLLVC